MKNERKKSRLQMLKVITILSPLLIFVNSFVASSYPNANSVIVYQIENAIARFEVNNTNMLDFNPLRSVDNQIIRIKIIEVKEIERPFSIGEGYNAWTDVNTIDYSITWLNKTEKITDGTTTTDGLRQIFLNQIGELIFWKTSIKNFITGGIEFDFTGNTTFFLLISDKWIDETLKTPINIAIIGNKNHYSQWKNDPLMDSPPEEMVVNISQLETNFHFHSSYSAVSKGTLPNSTDNYTFVLSTDVMATIDYNRSILTSFSLINSQRIEIGQATKFFSISYGLSEYIIPTTNSTPSVGLSYEFSDLILLFGGSFIILTLIRYVFKQ